MVKDERLFHGYINIDTFQQKSDYCRNAKLMYVLEGEVRLEAQGRISELKTSDFLVLNKGEDYSYQGTEYLMLAVLDLRDDAFEMICDGIKGFIACNSTVDRTKFDEKLRKIMRTMLLGQLQIREDKNRYSYLILKNSALYYELLEILVANFLIGTVQEKHAVDSGNVKRKEQIERYLNIHFAENVSLDDISEQLYISKGYLSRYFTQQFGMSFSIYLKELRLKHAMSELLFSDKPVTQLAYDNGFTSSSFFNRAFKEKYGRTPSELRKEFIEKQQQSIRSMDQSEVYQRLSHLLFKNQSFSGANTQGEHQHYDVAASDRFNPHWHGLINIGNAADVLRTDMQAHMQILGRQMNFRYGRFWSPFSDELYLDVNHRTGKYNFHQLDMVLENLISCGLKPFVVFEPKLERINENLEKIIVRTKYNAVIEELGNWRDIISAFFKRIFQKYGVEEIETWRFELPFDGYCLRDMDPVESYMRLYKVILDVIAQYTEKALLGGPALPVVAEDVLQTIVMELQSRRYKPAFMSIISFAYEIREAGEKYAYKSSREDYLYQDVMNYRRLLDQYGFEAIPIYVTEWNQTVADRSFVNDSCYRGAYIVKNLIDVQPYVGMVGYFSGTDLRTIYYDSSELLQGGNGLLSRDGIFKPSGFAFELLHSLGAYLVGQGSNYLITTDRRDGYYIIAHNMRELSYYFYKNTEDEIQKENINRIYADEESYTSEIVLDGMTEGTYQIRVHRVNENHGSILNLWKELDFSDDLSRKDIMYLEKICEPQLLYNKINIQHGQLKLQLQLEANEIALYEIRKMTE